MADLITAARAKQELGGVLGAADATLNANESTTIDTLVTSCSDAARRYCSTEWTSTLYDEIYNLDEQRFGLSLKHIPIISLTYLRSNYTPVLEISQTNSVTNQYATAAVLSTGLSLARIASGTTTTVTAGITWAACATIDALVTAINAIGSSWSARAISPYGLFSPADLYVSSLTIAPTDIRANYRPLYMHTESHPAYQIDPTTGRLKLNAAYPRWNGNREYADQYPSPQTTLRIKYTAGYATIPTDLQSAIAQWVAALFYKTKNRDPNAQNTFSASVGTSWQELTANMPASTKSILNNYRQPAV